MRKPSPKQCLQNQTLRMKRNDPIMVPIVAITGVRLLLDQNETKSYLLRALHLQKHIVSATQKVVLRIQLLKEIANDTW